MSDDDFLCQFPKSSARMTEVPCTVGGCSVRMAHGWGPRVPPSQVQPDDLVFFAGVDGTAKGPGHVGLVIGGGLMIEASSPDLHVRIVPYRDAGAVGIQQALAASWCA